MEKLEIAERVGDLLVKREKIIKMYENEDNRHRDQLRDMYALLTAEVNRLIELFKA